MDIAASIDFTRILTRVMDLEASEYSGLLEGTKLTPRQLISMEGHINWQDQYCIIDNALRISDIPSLGLLFAAKTPPTISLGILAVAAMSCKTVEEALDTLIRYQDIRSPLNHTQLDKHQDQLTLKFNDTIVYDNVGIFIRESWIVTIANSLSLLIGRDVTAIELDLGFSKPSYSQLFEKYVCIPYNFNTKETQFRLPVNYGERIIPTHDEHTKRWALELCEQQLQALSKHKNFAERTRSIIRKWPDHQLTQDEVAKQLFVSTRTFSRRLKEEGHTFKQLVDEEQKRLTLYYFTNTELTIESISGLVGYKDMSSFRRAFKRWFGMRPSEFPRKNQTTGKYKTG